jgi:hypothetical protein
MVEFYHKIVRIQRQMAVSHEFLAVKVQIIMNKILEVYEAKCLDDPQY